VTKNQCALNLWYKTGTVPIM